MQQKRFILLRAVCCRQDWQKPVDWHGILLFWLWLKVSFDANCHLLWWEQDVCCRVTWKILTLRHPIWNHKTPVSKIPLPITVNLKTEDFNNCFHSFNFNLILIFNFNLEISRVKTRLVTKTCKKWNLPSAHDLCTYYCVSHIILKMTPRRSKSWLT